MVLPYSGIEEFQHRLSETVILFDGEPIYVAGIDGRNARALKISYYKLPLKEDSAANPLSVAVDDPRLEAHNLRLGYVNTTRFGTLYLTRMPTRQARQGLCSGNVYVSPNIGRNFQHLIYENISEMFTGKYPSKREVASRITNRDNKHHQEAFSRRMALEYDELGIFKLHYRGKAIASGYSPDEMRLPDHLRYMSETLTEQGIRVA